MIDRLPQNVSHLVISQWLSIGSIVRVDAALLKSTFRAEWLELLGCLEPADQFVARNKEALVALSWVALRKLAFSSYAIEVTERNKVKRIAALSSLAFRVEKLTITQVPDPVRVLGFGDLHPTISSSLKSSFDYVFRRRRYERDSSMPNIAYDVPKEDGPLDTTLPALIFPKLSALALSGGKLRSLQWLPEAPLLQAMTIGGDLVDDAFLLRIASAYPHLRCLTLNITDRVTNMGIRCIAENCVSLTSLDLTGNGYTVNIVQSVQHLISSCPPLHYLALNISALSDTMLTAISSRGDRLLGLDLVFGHQVTSQGLNVITLGITCTRALYVDDYAALNHLLLGNALTLRTVALRFSHLITLVPKEGEVISSLAQCREVRSLFLCYGYEWDLFGIDSVLENCQHLQKLSLYSDTNYFPRWCTSFAADVRLQHPHVTLEWGVIRKRPVWGEVGNFAK